MVPHAVSRAESFTGSGQRFLRQNWSRPADEPPRTAPRRAAEKLLPDHPDRPLPELIHEALANAP
jgi:hypothetical protein